MVAVVELIDGGKVKIGARVRRWHGGFYGPIGFIENIRKEKKSEININSEFQEVLIGWELSARRDWIRLKQ